MIFSVPVPGSPQKSDFSIEGLDDQAGSSGPHGELKPLPGPKTAGPHGKVRLEFPFVCQNGGIQVHWGRQLELYISPVREEGILPTLKDSGAANSMQIGEIQFYGIPEPATICLLGLGGLSLLRRRRS